MMVDHGQTMIDHDQPCSGSQTVPRANLADLHDGQEGDMLWTGSMAVRDHFRCCYQNKMFRSGAIS